MTEREKIDRLRQAVKTAAEVLRTLGGFPLLITELELTLGDTEPETPRRSHEERWKKQKPAT